MKIAIANLARLQKMSDNKSFNQDLSYLIQGGIEYKDYCFNEDTIEQLANSFNEAVKDPNVDTIWFAAGGTKTLKCFDLIDWDLVNKEDKKFIGQSDLTHMAIPLVAMGKHFYYGPSLRISKDNPSFEEAKYIIDFLKTGEIKKYEYKNLIGDINNLDGSQIVGGHLMIASFMLGRHKLDLTNRYFFFEYHYVIGETLENLGYWLDNLAYTIKDNTPKGFIIGKITLFESDGSIMETSKINNYILEALKDFNLPIAYLDHSRQIIKFS